MHKNLLKVLLLGTVLVSVPQDVFSAVVTGTDAATHWYQPFFSKSAESIYHIGDTTTINDPVLGKVTGAVTSVNGSSVTLDFGGSTSTFSTGTSGHIVESTGVNISKGADVVTQTVSGGTTAATKTAAETVNFSHTVMVGGKATNVTEVLTKQADGTFRNMQSGDVYKKTLLGYQKISEGAKATGDGAKAAADGTKAGAKVAAETTKAAGSAVGSAAKTLGTVKWPSGNVTSIAQGSDGLFTLTQNGTATAGLNTDGLVKALGGTSTGLGSAIGNGTSPAVALAGQAAANGAAFSTMVKAGTQAVQSAVTPEMWNAAAQSLKSAGNASPTAAQVATKVGEMFKGELTDAATKAIDGVKDAATQAGAKAAEGAGVAAGDAAKMGADAVADGAAKAAETSVAAGTKAAGKVASGVFSPIAIWNVPQYVLVIMEALEGNNQDDATKEVTVKGAEPMQDSQGSQGSGASVSSPSTAMSGTTIAGSATALNNLLNMGTIDLSLLSTDVKKAEKQEVKKAVVASAAKSAADVAASEKRSTETIEEESLTSEEQREIMHRRALLLGEWATAATQIGEGSNAISKAFYDRAAAFASAANAAQGSLGGITAITDTDRFVLFEITRGAALSAVQLGLQGAVNLNDLEETATSTVDSSTTPKATVSVSGAKSQ